MFTRPLAGLALFTLAACNQGGEPAAPPAPEPDVSQPVADESGADSASEADGFTNYAADYTGTWAAPGDCGGPMTWEFAQDHVYTAGEMACDIFEIRDGYGQINLLTDHCVAEGTDQPDYGFTLTPMGKDRMEVDFRAKTVLERCE